MKTCYEEFLLEESFLFDIFYRRKPVFISFLERDLFMKLFLWPYFLRRYLRRLVSFFVLLIKFIFFLLPSPFPLLPSFFSIRIEQPCSSRLLSLLVIIELFHSFLLFATIALAAHIVFLRATAPEPFVK